MKAVPRPGGLARSAGRRWRAGYVGEKKAKSGEQIAVLAYFLYDQDGHDVHEVTVAVPREDAEAGDALVQDFLHHARFIDAVAPQR